MIFWRYIRCKATLTEVMVVILFIVMTGGMAGGREGTPVDTHLITESGVIAGYGTGSIAEGPYEPVMLIWHLGCDLKIFFPQLENNGGTLSVYLEPQINQVFSPDRDLELGVGIGLKYAYPLAEHISVYVIGSMGPHYITGNTKDQAKGLIFSDTIGAGFSVFLTERSALNFEYRLRHMSNAGLKQPNGGINTHFATVGYSIFF